MRTRGIALPAFLSAALALGIGPRAAVGQRLEPLDLAVGGGIGVTASARASGKAFHGALSFPVRALPRPEPGPFDERPRPRGHPTVHLRTELFLQGGTVTGAPFDCDRVTPLYCFGRSDENRILGATAFVRLVSPWVGRMRMRFYIDPIGAGVYHRRTKSREFQGPTTLCIIDGELVSCPDNPPWATFEYRSSRTSVGANTGFGMLVRVGDVRMFAELRAHRLFESGESIAGAAPVTLGFVF